jgi:hypothetical protein
VTTTTGGGRRTSAVVLLLLLIATMTGAAACSNDKPSVATDASGKPLLGPDAPASRRHALAIQLVMGASRRQDTLTFGEWARAAYAQRCPKMTPEQVAFMVHDGYQGRVDVSLTFAAGKAHLQAEPTCQPVPPTLRIAAVNTKDLTVTPPPARANPDLTPVDWFARFTNGEPAPTIPT